MALRLTEQGTWIQYLQSAQVGARIFHGSDPRLRFHTLVAANVLSIALRELDGEEQHLRGELALLQPFFDPPQPPPPGRAELRQTVRRLNEQLCEAIRGGAFDAPEQFDALAGLLRGLVVRKLEVANPRYLEAVTRRPGP